MKKLLVLMLVLGMATAANASLFLSIDGDTALEEISVCPGDTVMIDLYSDNTLAYGAYLDITSPDGTYGSDLGTWTGNASLTANGNTNGDSTLTFIDPPNEWLADIKSFNPALPLIPGVHAYFEFECLAEGDVQIWLWDYNYEQVLDIVTIHQVPEPATMLLLGLGGLLLRRRR